LTSGNSFANSGLSVFAALATAWGIKIDHIASILRRADLKFLTTMDPPTRGQTLCGGSFSWIIEDEEIGAAFSARCKSL
jgi:hypothetical protein